MHTQDLRRKVKLDENEESNDLTAQVPDSFDLYEKEAIALAENKVEKEEAIEVKEKVA